MGGMCNSAVLRIRRLGFLESSGGDAVLLGGACAHALVGSARGATRVTNASDRPAT